MKNKDGFSLLSFLLYLMFFSTIVCFICHSIIYFIIPSLRLTNFCQSRIALHTISDIFVRDVRMSNQFIIKKSLPNELLWNNGNTDIAWTYYNNRLTRIEGHYDIKWKKKTTSIISTDIANALFTIDYVGKKTIGIMLELKSIRSLKNPLHFYVAIRHTDE
jgi:hypothetical protein